MAQVVADLPKRKGGGGGRKPKYPYDEWLDGQVWKLEKGEKEEDGKDYTASHLSFLTSVRSAAKERQLKLQTRVFEDHVVIKAEKPETEKSETNGQAEKADTKKK